jgi:tetratricopeptide (TPR) repeat protein
MVERPGPYRFLALRRAKKLSAVKARQPRNAPQFAAPSDETPAMWQSLELWSKRLSTLTTIVLSLVAGGTLLIVIGLLAKDITRRTIEITPISVPQTLINNGYTSDAVTQRLQLALNKIIRPSHFLQLDRTTGLKKADAVPILQGQAPTITVPGTGLSFDTIRASIHAFFPNHWKVSGEITVDRNHLWLHLRMNGQDRYISEQGVELDHPDDLFMLAAEKVLDIAEPHRLAAYLATREPSKGLRLAQRIIKDSREKDDHVIAPMHVLVGQFFLRQSKTDDATNEFRQAIEHDPDALDARIGFGTALKSQGKTGEARIAFEKAVAELRKAKDSDPRSASAHANLGLALLMIEENKTSAARDEFETANKLDPNDPDTYIYLGVASEIENKLEDRIGELRKAIDLDPSSAFTHVALGDALGDQGKSKERDDEFSTAFKLEPRNMSVYFLVAALLLESGKTKEALDVYRKGVDIDPNFTFAHIMLGNALDKVKKAEDALDEYHKAVDLDPNSAYTHIVLGSALYKAKRAKEAATNSAPGSSSNRAPSMLT